MINKLSIGEYPEGKTSYQIVNEEGEYTTITLEKWVADILQRELPSVDDAIQKAYNIAVEKHPNLSRREKGNVIRSSSVHKANQYQNTKKSILGWNDQDIIDIF